MKQKKKLLVYVAGPYSATDHEGIARNIDQAREVAKTLWEEGFAVICPHLNTAHFEIDCLAGYEDYMQGDFLMVERCDAVVMLPGYESSKGALREAEHAQMHGVPVYFWPERPHVHDFNKWTLCRSPEPAPTVGRITGLQVKESDNIPCGPEPAPVNNPADVAYVQYHAGRMGPRTADLFGEMSHKEQVAWLEKNGYARPGVGRPGQQLDTVGDVPSTIGAVSRLAPPDKDKPLPVGPGSIRTFSTGATRDTDNGKLKYEGFFSPRVLKRRAEYMHKHRKQADGSLREPDNWQKGMERAVYMDSLLRHIVDAWDSWRWAKGNADKQDFQDLLCAIMFNAEGMLFEILQGRDLGRQQDTTKEVRCE